MKGPAIPLPEDERGVPCAMLAMVKDSITVFPSVFHQTCRDCPSTICSDIAKGRDRVDALHKTVLAFASMAVDEGYSDDEALELVRSALEARRENNKLYEN